MYHQRLEFVEDFWTELGGCVNFWNMAKKVREFLDQTEGLMARDYLAAQGILAELEGVRDYSSIVVGGVQGRYQLLVDEKDFAQAVHAMQAAKMLDATLNDVETETTEVSYRRAVSFAIIAMLLLPWIGNYISVREGLQYVRLKPQGWSTSIFVVVLSLLQIPGLFFGFFILMTVFRILGFPTE